MSTLYRIATTAAVGFLVIFFTFAAWCR